MIKKLKKAIQDERVTISDISETYNVSNRTVERWLSNQAKPKLEIQYELANLLESDQIEQVAGRFRADEIRLRHQFDKLLLGLRESFHRWGKYSSRNEALEELCKLVLAQISLVKQNKSGFHDFNYFEISAKVNEQFISKVNEAIAYSLGESIDSEIFAKGCKISITRDQDSLIREICQEFKKVDWGQLKTLSRLDLFNEIFGRFLASSFTEEKEMGQYLTPIEMTRFMVTLSLSNLTTIELNTLTDPIRCKTFGYVLDPSCGAGSFLVEIVHQLLPEVIEKHGETGAKKWIENMGKHVLVGIDKSNRMARLTVFSFCSFGLPTKNILSINSLDINSQKEVLINKLGGKVRLILTNPPFGAEFSGNVLAAYQLFSNWSSSFPRKIDSELLFIERYVSWLAEGGHCVSVVPDSVLTNKGLYQDLRIGIHSQIGLKSVVSFPSETFSAAGTTAKTSVINFAKSTSKVKETYFGICKNLGYKVITKGSSKAKISFGISDLDPILNEIIDRNTPIKLGRRVEFDTSFYRWDANFHAALNEIDYQKISASSKFDVVLSQVADLINDRLDPRRVYDEFRYIEISDIQPSGMVSSKPIKSIEAPSRARKQIKVGDVLASTVRPDQRKIGYVLNKVDENAICTTGLAVLRPKGIEPSLLVELLKSEFVTNQLLRNNIGIAYPAIDENCFLDIVLPIRREEIQLLGSQAKELEGYRIKLAQLEDSYKSQIQSSSAKWSARNGTT